MTIALGILTDEGAVLCADSQYTSRAKTHGQKVFVWAFGGCSVSFAFAGSVAHATMAIQKCQLGLTKMRQDRTVENVLGVIERTLLRVQRDHIDPRPYEERQDAQYLLIFGVATRYDGGQPHLFYVDRNVPVQFDTYVSIGTGADYLGEYILRQAYRRNMSLEAAIVLGMHALMAAKQHDANCGGPSQFVTIHKGTVSGVVPFDISQAENGIANYERWAAELLLETGDLGLSDDELGKRLDKFVFRIREMRRSLRENGLPYRELIEGLRVHLSTAQVAVSAPSLVATTDRAPLPTPEGSKDGR